MSDELFAQLSELPTIDVNELGSARLRKRAHQVLERQQQGRSVQSPARRALLLVQSTVIGAVATGYLFWVVDSVLTPYR